jgi:hypothetical protein
LPLKNNERLNASYLPPVKLLNPLSHPFSFFATSPPKGARRDDLAMAAERGKASGKIERLILMLKSVKNILDLTQTLT